MRVAQLMYNFKQIKNNYKIVNLTKMIHNTYNTDTYNKFVKNYSLYSDSRPNTVRLKLWPLLIQLAIPQFV